MRSLSVVVLLLAALAVLFLAALPSASLAATDLTSYEQQILKAVNEERADAGLGKLKLNDSLVDAARAHAADMGAAKYFTHDSIDGTAWSDRIRAHGYTREGYKSWKAGENIAWGAGIASAPVYIVDQWMHSAPHRAVILGKGFKEIGIGAVSTEGYGEVEGTVWFFTMDLGARAK